MLFTGVQLSVSEYLENRDPARRSEDMIDQTPEKNTPTFLAPAYIAFGTSVITVYVAGLLQKLTSPTPRELWAKKIAACNGDLISFLLGCRDLTVPSESKRFRGQKSKITAEWQTMDVLGAIRKVERLVRKQGLSFVLKLDRHQLRHCQRLMLDINSDYNMVYQKYGYTFTSREFAKNLADLESCLQQTIQACSMLDKRKSSTVKLITSPSKEENNDKQVLQKQGAIIVQVPFSFPKNLRKNPSVIWAAVSLRDYLRSLIGFSNSYGYGDTEVGSLIKSRLLYIADPKR